MVAKQTFKPNHFTPVVEVSLRDSGAPAPAETDFSALETVVGSTLDVANASARGSGAVLPMVVPASNVAKVIGFVLACKNIVEQLSFLQVYSRVSGPLRQSPNSLEPIVRFYNYLGHFEHEGKTYVSRGLEQLLVHYLFKLRQWASEDLCDLTKNVVNMVDKDFKEIDVSFYGLGPDGNIVFQKKRVLKQYIRLLISQISEADSISDADSFSVMRMALDLSTEDSLNNFLRFLKLNYPSFEIPGRNREDAPNDKHKAAMKKLFGNEYSADGDVIPVAKFSEVISRAFSLLRTITLERSYVMKTLPFPKYEGGSAAQLGSLVDDVLMSDIPLSLDDSTVATAVKLSYGAASRFKGAPNVDRNETLRSLVAQSIIKQ